MPLRMLITMTKFLNGKVRCHYKAIVSSINPCQYELIRSPKIYDIIKRINITVISLYEHHIHKIKSAKHHFFD